MLTYHTFYSPFQKCFNIIADLNFYGLKLNAFEREKQLL